MKTIAVACLVLITACVLTATVIFIRDRATTPPKIAAEAVAAVPTNEVAPDRADALSATIPAEAKGAASDANVARDRADALKCNENLRMLTGAAHQYALDNNNQWPASVGILVGEASYIRYMPLCGAHGTYSFDTDGYANCSVHGLP